MKISIPLLILSLCFGMISTDALAQRNPTERSRKLGIVGQPAPQWKTSKWHNVTGKESPNIGDYKGKVLYLYFFQSWCPGCHKIGFPTLKKVSEAFRDDDSVEFVAIQTTFEGHSTNTADKLKEISEKYKLAIPFGQSAETRGTPDIMKKYRTGGTPWVVIVDPQGRVVFNDYHVDADAAIKGIRQLKPAMQKTLSSNAVPTASKSVTRVN